MGRESGKERILGRYSSEARGGKREVAAGRAEVSLS